MITAQQTTDQALFTDSFKLLKQAVIQQGAAQRRVAIRVKYLIRSLMVAIVTTLLFIFYLIFLLTRQVDVLSEQLDLILAEGDRVLHSVGNIDKVMMKFEAQMDTLPYINESVGNIENNLSLVTGNVAGITDNIGVVNQQIHQLRQTMGRVTGNVRQLEQTVHRVNRDVNAASEPIRRFNDMNPFNYMR